ncbi:hypothetical protein FJZ18_02600 [Candidatus Pacearchaeota archaeon]|nr:hypothetical protein [Candidatus Pacearchaeota archaeon]
MKGVSASVFVLSVTLFLVIFSLSFVLAEEAKVVASSETAAGVSASPDSSKSASTNTDVKTESGSSSSSAIPEEYKDEKLEGSTSLTPGSWLYWWEGVRTNFRSDDDNARQKALEVKSSIEKGDFEAAKKAYESYREYSAKLEKEANPEKKEKIQRDSAAVKNTIKELKERVPEKDRKELVDGVVQQAELNAKAVAVADKIKTLCQELAKIDPSQYAKTCRVDKETPKWRQDQDKKLTDSQKEEVKKFKDIMIQCMQSKGAQCKCDEITFKDFATRCSIVAPLVNACENKGDKASCEKMDDATEGIEETLPEHLQDAFADVQEGINREQFSRFLPKECEEAKAKTPEECSLVMIEKHAPELCKEELKKQKVTNERDARRICEEIMFKENTPKECIDAGIKDPRKCGTFMCEKNFPQECKDAGLSCSDRNSPRRCEEIMRLQGGGERRPQFSSTSGSRCREIKDPEDRLKCFDSVDAAVNNVAGHYGGFGPENFGSFNDEFSFEGNGPGVSEQGKRMNTGKGVNPANFPPECRQAGATTKEACEKILIQASKNRANKMREYEENFARQCLEKGGRWDCSFSSIDPSNPCRCFQDEQRFNNANEGNQFGKDDRRFDNRQQGNQGKFPEPCRQKGATTPEACRAVMEEWGRQQRDQGEQQRRDNDQRQREFQQQQDQFRQEQERFRQEQDKFRNQQPPQQPPTGTQPPAGTQPPSETLPPPSSPPPSSPPPQDTSSSSGTSGSSITGGVIAENDFLRYYFR